MTGSKSLIFILIIIIIVITFFVLVILDVEKTHKTIESSNCEQLFQFIKDRGDETPPKHDKILSK